MWTRSRRAAALAALLACFSVAPAYAQDPDEESNLGDEPPVELADGEESPRGDDTRSTGRGTQNGAQLANTGAEPALIGMAGLGLLLAGTGLRLRLPRREF
jgi:hypothetical protein